MEAYVRSATETPPTNPTTGRTERHLQEPVAVVGLSCRLPGHNSNPQAFWEFLEQGRTAENRPPDSRFHLEGHYDGSRKPHTMTTPGGMWVEDIDPELFDARFFNMSTADAISMDPQQRQLLEVVYEALESSGMTLEGISASRLGCLVASMCGDYEVIQGRDPDEQVESTTPGVSRSIQSNRVSHFFNITGPSMTIDTACSGSLTIVDVACRYLQSGQADGMIVAGVNMYLDPLHNEDVGLMRATASLSGKCHTFDAKADGYVRAEAVNCLVLKRLDDAVRDGDPIRAVIRGTACNNDGWTPGITQPSPEAQAVAIRQAYANAGITNFNDTAFLECHGTGTQTGDPIEVKGLAAVFAPTRQEPLTIGSVKSNIGHSEAGAGISALIKTVMALERGVIPGNPTFHTPNPKIDFEGCKVRVAKSTMRWPAGAMLRASVNSFGFGGSNAHAVIESPRYLAPAASGRYIRSHQDAENFDFDMDDDLMSDSPEKPTLLVVSANDEESLKKNIKALEAHLLNPQVSVKLEDLAYTLSEKRSHHFHRGFVSTTSVEEIPWNNIVEGKRRTRCAIAMVFTGQGAQWPQMGKQLLAAFPEARAMIERLDQALATLPETERPSWRLAKELTEPRGADVMRQPEFSQPLVTALQLAYLSVLEKFGVTPSTVIGHSSGEIAAAAAAGFLAPEDAIKIAYFRGFASKMSSKRTEAAKDGALGMLAVGIGADLMPPYLEGSEVEVACYNSPSSVTLSGRVAELEKVEARLKTAGVFARMLQVDLAYHSKYMAEIGETYKELLLARCQKPLDGSREIRWFSSVTGTLVGEGELADAEYWRMNMVSPVRFAEAAAAMLQVKEPPNMLVELGPSNALAGPISQIIKSLPGSDGIQYTAVAKRGPSSLQALFDTAGHLYVAGAAIDLARVNQYDKPKFIVDMPNYQWNHSTRFWNEGPASKDWRFRKFILHDLLGSKVPGTSWTSPSFSRLLRLSDVPWLRDHKLGDQVVLPGTAYFSMAAEAVFQTTMVTEWKMQAPESYRYRMQDIKLMRGMVLEENADTRIMLSLSPTTRSTSPWFVFRIYTRRLGEEIETIEHCSGLICVEVDPQSARAQPEQLKPLRYPAPGALWYKACQDVGFSFGPGFQRLVDVECTPGSRAVRATVSLAHPETPWQQSPYAMHPACMDSCTQAFLPGVWNGDRAAMSCVTIGTHIDSLVFNGRPASCEKAMCVARVEHIPGRREGVAENYLGHCSLYHPTDGTLLLEIAGFQLGRVEAREDSTATHVYKCQMWNPDVSTLSQAQLQQYVDEAMTGATDDVSQSAAVQAVIDLVVFKTPTLRVLELCRDPTSTSSLWLEAAQEQRPDVPSRGSSSGYHYITNDAGALLAARDQYAHIANTEFSLVASSHPPALGNDKHHLVIAKLAKDDTDLSAVGAFIREALTGEGYALVVSDQDECGSILSRAGLRRVHSFTYGPEKRRAYLAQPGDVLEINGLRQAAEVNLVHFTEKPSPEALQAAAALEQEYCWKIKHVASPVSAEIQRHSTVLVLDELVESVLGTVNAEQWDGLQGLVQNECKLLWVTCGGQLHVTDPTKAAINGLLRVIRREEPHLNHTLMTLDIASPAGEETVSAIDKCLCLLTSRTSAATTAISHPVDVEFAERGGVMHVSRVVPDVLVNSTWRSESSQGSLATDTALFERASTIRLAAEQIGTMDHLCFREVSAQPPTLQPNHVEVDIVAAGLNFKDVATTLGIVPSDEFRLGWECSGVVAAVAADVTKFRPGQRVAVYGTGSLANRIQTTCERVHAIPDSMSFDEAATVPVAYMTALYALYDLAQLRKGQRVLIHSATGGVGIAAIQLARHVGAEVFATVGSEEKRRFLEETWSVPPHQIFSSRTRDFGAKILALTRGAGIDVVLNSLTGELLEESWRIVAAGGTLVDISKKDMLARNALPMEPFTRNASYRALDTSLPSFTDDMIARCLSQTFHLMEQGRLQPIAPVTAFGFDAVPDALRLMRGAKHLGKLVISRSVNENPRVLVRSAPRKFAFRDDASYLIVGGLKGLCGSIALWMAQNGAKNISAMARSGYDDEKSRGVIKGIEALGCHIDLITGDVSSAEDVRRAFGKTRVPVGGVIQGAMVLRDRPFSSMTMEEYNGAVQCKIRGTWNLHDVSEALGLRLDFFTMLSSISGVIGQQGQANYAAANVVLDAFASYRRARGLQSCTVDLGAVDDVGYIAAHKDDAFMAKVDGTANNLSHINERLFRKIIELSLLQQTDAPINHTSAAQVTTGLAVPLPEDSDLRSDARLAGLFMPANSSLGAAAALGHAEGDGQQAGLSLREFQLMLHSKAEPAALLASLVKVMCLYFSRSLRLGDDIDPDRPLSAYGIDSLSATEVRNWVRTSLGAALATFEITNAASITALCEKVIAKLTAA